MHSANRLARVQSCLVHPGFVRLPSLVGLASPALRRREPGLSHRRTPIPPARTPWRRCGDVHPVRPPSRGLSAAEMKRTIVACSKVDLCRSCLSFQLPRFVVEHLSCASFVSASFICQAPCSLLSFMPSCRHGSTKFVHLRASSVNVCLRVANRRIYPTRLAPALFFLLCADSAAWPKQFLYRISREISPNRV